MTLTPKGFTRVTDESSYEKSLSGLDTFQAQAVTSDAENIVLRAPAGSGKTKSIIAAIAAYRYEHLNDRICAITYTRAARAEMEARLQELGVHDVEVTTIHVWSRNLLNDLSIKYDFKIRVLEENQIKSILEELVEEYIKRSRVKKINIGILYTYITGSKNMDITDNYRRTLNALELRYINYKRDNGLYDFTDYPLYLFNVLEAYDEKVYNIDALFVDEFQDVDEIQLEIFKKVLTNKKFFVGDEWQSIFQFRGADGLVFKKLEDFEVYKLKNNYRSYQEIIDYAATVYLKLRHDVDDRDCYISEVMYSHSSGINCARGQGGQVAVINPFGRIYRSDNWTMGSSVNEIFNKFMKLKPMILCRTNKQVKAIEEEKYFEVSTVHQAKGLEYKSVIVIDTTINGSEDLNIAYVAMTRAEDNLLVINWQQFEHLFKMYMNKNTLGGF